MGVEMMESFSFIINEKHKKLVQTILNEYVFRDKVNGFMLIDLSQEAMHILNLI